MHGSRDLERWLIPGPILLLVTTFGFGCIQVGAGGPIPEAQVPGFTYYVSVSGDDENAGAMQAPFRSIQRAADLVEPGDSVFVGAGTYSGFMVQRGGTADRPVLFQAQEGAVVIDDGNARTADAINIESWDYSDPPSYVVIDGFEITGSPRMGIRVIGGRGVVIRDNRVSDSAMFGIFSGYAPEIQVIGNVVTGTRVGSAPTEGHGIYLSNSDTPDDDIVVRGNIVSGNGGNGIQLNASVDDGDSVFTGALIEDNLVSGSYYKGFSLIGISDSVIRNNVVYDNGRSGDGAGGIHLVNQPDMGNYSCGNLVVNNTIVEPRLAAIRINEGSERNVLFNNICVSGHPIALEGSGNFVDAASNIERGSDAGLFADARAGDYRPAPGGIAVDKGVPSYHGSQAPAADIIGTARPRGAGFDIGAYETNP